MKSKKNEKLDSLGCPNKKKTTKDMYVGNKKKKKQKVDNK